VCSSDLEQQKARNQAVEAAYEAAARVPLSTARLCLEAIKMAWGVATKGNVNSASDAGVAALVGRAGVEGAALNVLTNLGSVRNQAFKDECRQEVDRLMAESGELCAKVTAHVRSTFGQ
jgi:formiminotetrahydrofolate cyclodeaminase